MYRAHLLPFISVVLSLLAGGCASFRSAGTDRPWQKVTTDHFVLRTDFDARIAGAAARQLEATRDALVSAAWGAIDFPAHVRTEVFLLSNELQFEALFGPAVVALLAQEPRPAFFLSGPPIRWEQRESPDRQPMTVLRRVMAHQLEAAVYFHPPMWFAEGLAQYLETVHESGNQKWVIVGDLNPVARQEYFWNRTVSIRRMLEWNEPVGMLSESEVAGLRGISYAFVHWLYNTKHDAFLHYEAELARGVDPKQAWQSAFSGFDPATTDAELHKYMRYGEYWTWDMPLQWRASPAQQVAMTAADTRVARARVMLAAASDSTPEGAKSLHEDAKAEIEKALALEPTHVDALELDTATPSGERLARVRRAVEAHRDDSNAFRLLAELLTRSGAGLDERERAYRRAAELDTTDAQSLIGLARVLLERHRPLEAVPLTVLAVRRAPFDATIVDTYALALYQAGQCRTAAMQERRAIDLGRRWTPTERGALAGFARHLSEFETECGPSAQAR
jgi:tetratricopeptide (TPR) repeat protein